MPFLPNLPFGFVEVFFAGAFLLAHMIFKKVGTFSGFDGPEEAALGNLYGFAIGTNERNEMFQFSVASINQFNEELRGRSVIKQSPQIGEIADSAELAFHEMMIERLTIFWQITLD